MKEKTLSGCDYIRRRCYICGKQQDHPKLFHGRLCFYVVRFISSFSSTPLTALHSTIVSLYWSNGAALVMDAMGWIGKEKTCQSVKVILLTVCR